MPFKNALLQPDFSLNSTKIRRTEQNTDSYESTEDKMPGTLRTRFFFLENTVIHSNTHEKDFEKLSRLNIKFNDCKVNLG